MRDGRRLRYVTVATLLALLGTACSAASGGGASKAASKYPEKQVTLINAYAAGGGTDIMFRNVDAVAQKIKAFPQSFIVETKTGGSGSTGKAAALNAKNDGYTLTIADDGSVYQQLGGDQPFKYDDFTYIARLVTDYNMVVVRTESPFKTFKDFVEAGKAKPKGVSVAGTSIGSTDQLQLVQLGKKAGAEFNYTAFNSGGEVLTNVLAIGQRDEVLPLRG